MGCQSAVQAVRAISSTTEAADLPEVSALLGFGDAAEDERGLLVDIAVRRAVEAGLLRLRTGILRPAKRHLPLLDDPARPAARVVVRVAPAPAPARRGFHCPVGGAFRLSLRSFLPRT